MLRKLCPSFTCSVANVTRLSSQMRVDVCRAHTSTQQCILCINLFSSLSNILIKMFTGAIVLLIVVSSSKLIIVVPHETYLFYIKRPNSQRPLLEMLAAVSDDFSNCRCSSHNRHALVRSIYATVNTVKRRHLTDIRACPTGPVQWGSSHIMAPFSHLTNYADGMTVYVQTDSRNACESLAGLFHILVRQSKAEAHNTRSGLVFNIISSIFNQDVSTSGHCFYSFGLALLQDIFKCL